MSDKIVEFLVQLSKDPAAMDAYRRDPEAALSRTGLSAADRAALKSGDAAAIFRHLGMETLLAESQSQSQIKPPPPPPKPPGPPPPPPKTPPPGTEPKRNAASA